MQRENILRLPCEVKRFFVQGAFFPLGAVIWLWVRWRRRGRAAEAQAETALPSAARKAGPSCGISGPLSNVGVKTEKTKRKSNKQIQGTGEGIPLRFFYFISRRTMKDSGTETIKPMKTKAYPFQSFCFVRFYNKCSP